jgi:hypothetical protein
VNFPSVVINSSENKDRMLIERIRIAAFFIFGCAFRLLCPSLLSFLSLSCLSTLVLSSAPCLVLSISFVPQAEENKKQ